MNGIELEKNIFRLAPPIALSNFVTNFIDKYYEGEHSREDLDKVISEAYNLGTDEGYFITYLLSFESNTKEIRESVVDRLWNLHRGDLRILMQTVELIRNEDYLTLFNKLSTLRYLYFTSSNDSYIGLIYTKACCALRNKTDYIGDERWTEYMLKDLRVVQKDAVGTALECCFEMLIGLEDDKEIEMIS